MIERNILSIPYFTVIALHNEIGNTWSTEFKVSFSPQNLHRNVIYQNQSFFLVLAKFVPKVEISRLGNRIRQIHGNNVAMYSSHLLQTKISYT